MITWLVITALSIYAIIASIVLIISIRMNLDYSDKLQEIKEATEEALDVLNTFYQRAAARAELEVMSDEPVVRELVTDLKGSRDAILLVANIIVDPLQEDDEEGTE